MATNGVYKCENCGYDFYRIYNEKICSKCQKVLAANAKIAKWYDLNDVTVREANHPKHHNGKVQSYIPD